MRVRGRPYAPDRLARVAVSATSFVDMLRWLEQPLGSEPLRYLRSRLRHYGIDTDHFVDEPLPETPRKRYTKEVLREAASQCTSLREMIAFLGIAPCSSAYSHLSRRLKQFGIDTSHFTTRASGGAVLPEEPLRAIVSRSESFTGVMRELGLTENSTSRRKVKKAIAAYGISTCHFTGQGHYRGRISPHRKSADDILRLLAPGSRRTSREHLHRALREKRVPYQCQECGLGDRWQGKRLVLEIDHLNGDRLDNRLTNLRYLCPSCHSQTDSFGGRHGSDRRGPQERISTE